MQTMEVAWNGTTLNDKVKLLSGTEVGYSSAEQVEGARYIIYSPYLKGDTYWLRSRAVAKASNNAVWAITNVGNISDAYYYGYSWSLVPCIRLSTITE